MNFEQMKSFVSIAKTGSFSVSARERYISQPTISNHLKMLEDEMGVQLISRSSKKVELTEKGTVFLEYAKRMILLEEECEYKVKHGAENEKTVIDIVAPGLQTDCQFTEFMIRYAEQNRDHKIVCRLVDREDERIAEIVKEGKADFAISSYKTNNPELTCDLAFVEEILLITPNISSYKNMSRAEFQDCLLHDRYIRFDFGEGSDYLWTDSISKTLGVSLHRIRTAARCANYRIVLRMVERNLGIAFISNTVIAEPLRQGRIHAIRCRDILQKPFYLIYDPKKIEASEKLSRIRDMLRDELEHSIPQLEQIY
ncbi:HTH-type transcriptional regulator TdfR [Lachnospiraceae bacterium]|nr:HTH-type transcriptional regulator TdfR [Lachnospiraceae bacterium]